MIIIGLAWVIMGLGIARMLIGIAKDMK